MSADSTSLYEPLEAIREREREREEEKCKTENIKNGQRKETNTESGARHRIFGDGLRSMGSARVGCQMLYVDGMLRW